MKRTDVGRLRRKGGFTLVELIVVLVLMAVLASVAVPTYLSYVDDNKAKQCERQRQSLAAYLEDMSVTNPNATMKELLTTYAGKDIAECPTSGTAYTYVGTNTVHCDTHGDTTVILKKSSGVTAEATYEYETNPTPPQSEPETTPPENIIPPEPETDPPVEPSLTVSISPKQLNLKKDETGTFEATITATGYSSYTTDWTIEDGTVALVAGTDNQATVTGLKSDSTTVTCTVTADNGKATESATANVVVEEEETETDEPEVSSADFLINGRASNEETITVWFNLENCPDLARLSLPSGGQWSSSDDAVTVLQGIGEVKIRDEFRGGTYNFVYTAPNGDIYNITGRVVYPITGIEYGFHIGLWPDGSATGEDKGKYEINIEDKADMWIGYTPAHTTDRGSIEWKSSDTSVAVIDQVRTIDTYNQGNRGYSIATIRALKPGKTTISWTVDNEHEKNRETRNQELTVVDPTQLSKIRVDSMKLKVGDAPKIQPVCEPEGASLKNITFSYSGNGDCISIDTDGTIHALKNGLATVTVQALKNGKPLEGCSCSFDVAVTDLNSISVTPSPVEMGQGESKSAQIICDPPTADTSEIHYEFSYDTNALEIVEKNSELSITAKSNYNTSVTVKAFMGDVQVVETGFNVNIISGTAENSQGISVVPSELKLMQGKTARISINSEDGADLVVYPSSDGGDLSGLTFKCWTEADNGRNILITDENAKTITGNNVGTVTLIIQMVTYWPEQKDFRAQVSVTVYPDPEKPVTYYVNGQKLSSVPWKVLQDYIQAPELHQPRPTGIFAVSENEFYILKENAKLIWDSSYEDITFSDYLSRISNRDECFIRVNQSSITWRGYNNFFMGSVGDILGIQDVGYYVCVREIPAAENKNTGEWTEDFLNRYFMRLT